MSPNSCPYCGAPLLKLKHESERMRWVEFACGSTTSTHAELGVRKWQAPQCARYVRVRISQLKRMAELAEDLALCWRVDCTKANIRHNRRLRGFLAACTREIDHLRNPMEPKA